MAQASAPHPFRAAPKEIRLLLWETTWLQPRVFKLHEHSGTDSDTDSYFVHFQFLRSLEVSHGHRNSPGRLQKEVPKVPVALHVCHESREHALRTFVLLQHKLKPAYALYVNPKVDIFQIGPTTSLPRPPNDHNYRHKFIESLRQGYKGDLESKVKNITTTSDYLRDARSQLSCFRGVTQLHIIFKENTSTKQANNITKQIQVIKGIVGQYFKLFDPKNPPSLRARYRVVGEPCINKEYPSEMAISVKFMDKDYQTLDSTAVRRDQYWWSINLGGGGFFAALQNVGSNDDENNDEGEN